MFQDASGLEQPCETATGSKHVRHLTLGEAGVWCKCVLSSLLWCWRRWLGVGAFRVAWVPSWGVGAFPWRVGAFSTGERTTDIVRMLGPS